MSSGLSRLFTQMQTDDWISKAIDGAYAEQRRERWGPPTLEIHPSAAGSPCARNVQLAMLGHRDGVSAQSRRRMDNGTGAHDRWNRYFQTAGILEQANIRKVVRDYWNGEADLFARHPRTGKLCLVELKTMNANRWRNVPAQAESREVMALALARVEPAYVVQLINYFVMFCGDKTRFMDECAFLFENTDTQEFKVRYLRPTPELIAQAFANADQARAASAAGVLLAPPFKMQSMPCRKCYREGLCYALQRDEAEPWLHVTAALQELKERASESDGPTGAAVRAGGGADAAARLASDQYRASTDAVVEMAGQAQAGGEEDSLFGWLDGPGSA